MAPNQAKLRVLLADDSAFVRRVLQQALEAEGDIEVVGTAADGREALHKSLTLAPDVVVTDLLMPEWTGVDYIRAQMERRPLPIVAISVISRNNRMTIAALEAGAVDFVRKPASLRPEALTALGAELRERVRLAVQARPERLAALTRAAKEAPPAWSTAPLTADVLAHRVVLIAASTGGPQALRYLLARLPAMMPPVLVVQHLPEGYSAALAERLDALSPLKVVEAADHVPLQAGWAYLGKAGWHLTVAPAAAPGAAPQCRLSRTPAHWHYPSADVLFRSAVQVFGPHTLAVVLTGMGRDGLEGAAWVKAQGGQVLAEHERSAVVYGMPRAVVEAGLADRVLPLSGMPEAIVEWVRQGGLP